MSPLRLSLLLIALAPLACGDSTPPAGSDAAPGDSDAAPGADAPRPAPPPLTSAVSIVVEPGDHGDALVSAIQGATSSVHLTMYLLGSPDVLPALEDRPAAGVDVQVVLNQTFPSSSTSNQSAYDELAGLGVPVRWAPAAFTYTHAKTALIDGDTAWIMSMNASQSSMGDNREYLAIDTDADDVAEAEAIFAADYAGSTPSVSGKLVVAPVNARPKLIAMLVAAETRVDIEAESLSDGDITDFLAATADRGVAVRIVLSDSTPSAAQTTSVATLKAHGVQLRTVSTPYIHAKSMVIDGDAAYVGSENYTFGSLSHNREIGVVFDAPAAVATVLATTQADFASGTSL